MEKPFVLNFVHAPGVEIDYSSHATMDEARQAAQELLSGASGVCVEIWDEREREIVDRVYREEELTQ